MQVCKIYQVLSNSQGILLYHKEGDQTMNKEKTRILIGDNTVESGIKVASGLCEHGFYAFTRSNNFQIIYESILNDLPDIVIVHLTMGNYDAVQLMQKVRNTAIRSPRFIILTDVMNSFVERQVMEAGAERFLAEPVDFEQLLRAVSTSAARPLSCINADPELMVTECMNELGIPAHIKGYGYIRTAILAAMYDRRMLDSVTKRLYCVVAEQYGTTPMRVERAIRHAIELAWMRKDSEIFSSYFGYSVKSGERPTNSEFIAMVADKVRLRYKAVDIEFSVSDNSRNFFLMCS